MNSVIMPNHCWPHAPVKNTLPSAAGWPLGRGGRGMNSVIMPNHCGSHAPVKTTLPPAAGWAELIGQWVRLGYNGKSD